MKSLFQKIIPLDSPFRVTYHYIRAWLAFKLSGNPAKDMIVIGVTGTKGKTTTANIITRGLQSAGHKVAMFSTVNMVINKETIENNLKMTTPSPFVLWDFIKKAKQAKCKYLVVETSSHALYYHRVLGLHYDIAVLTNISHDHLDLHKTMTNYVATKLQLFKNLYKYGVHKGVRKVSVVNIDHEYADMFLSKDIVTDNLYTVGFGSGAQIQAEDVQQKGDAITFSVKIPSNRFSVSTRLFGDFNVSNILCAIAVFMSQKIEIPKIQEVIEDFYTLPGRLEEIPNKKKARIFVDYAHTENSLQNILETTGKLKGPKGRLLIVFGATGDRDTSKRPLMGKVADMLADVVIVTDDDTYTEDSSSIIRGVVEGISRQEGEKFWIIPSRSDAIRTALVMLRAGDVLVVAGKGAETLQITQKGPIPWNDRQWIEEVLKEINNHELKK